MNLEPTPERYTRDLIGLLELVWGEGGLSPGGPEEVRRLVGDMALEGESLLDIGCGTGGVDIMLAEEYHVGPNTAIDVETTVLEPVRRRALKRGLDDRITFVKVERAPCRFPTPRSMWSSPRQRSFTSLKRRG